MLSDDVEKRLRMTLVETKGGKKGDLSKAIEEAVEDWIEQQGQKKRK